MKNLLQEIISNLENIGKSLDDVLWIGTEDYTISKVAWTSALDVDYDNGYGGEEIDTSLKVVGKDWWLERETYDGSEWFEYKTYPTKPNDETYVVANLKYDWRT